jgi:hypothetical protein
LWVSIAAVLAPLLSIVIFAGVPFHQGNRVNEYVTNG